MTDKTKTASSAEATFGDLGISPKLLEVLTRNHFVTPTPIQEKAIPVALEGTDVIGIAQTGTGKTLAFAVPALQRVSRSKGQALVLAPTRELALQAEETFNQLGRVAGIRVAVLIGGASMGPQLAAIRRGPHVIIATPGRLIDHLEQGNISLQKTNVLILDEADRMWDMGFAPQVKKILQRVPEDRQTMLFSATMPDDIAQLAKQFMKTPVAVEVARQGSAAEQVDQELYVVDRRQKRAMLQHVLEEEPGTVIVFTRTKYGAKKTAKLIRQMGHDAVEIHGNRSLAQRKSAIEGFKKGAYRVLVATDVVGRGIDISDISLVLNFDLPEQPDDYIHRIGRTGRAGASGKAISFATPDQGRLVSDIERLMRKQIPMKKAPKVREVDIVREDDWEDRPERPSRQGRGKSRKRRNDDRYGSSSRGRADRPRRDDRPSREDRPRRDDRAKRGDRPNRDDRPKREDRPRRDDDRGAKRPPRGRGRGGNASSEGGKKKRRFPPKRFYGGMGV